MRSRSSLKYRLLAFSICATVIPSLAIGITAYSLTNSSLLNSAISSTEQMNVHKADTFDLFASELEITLKDLTDSEATKAFLQLRNEPDSESYYLSVVRLAEKMDTLITQRGEAVSAVAFLWNDGALPMIRSNGVQFPLFGDYRSQSPYKEMLQSDAAVHWIVLAGEDGSENQVFLYKVIYDVLSNENIGLTLIQLDPTYVESILYSGSHALDRTLLLSEKGELVFSVGTLPRERLPHEKLKQFFADNAERDSTFSEKVGGYLVSIAQSEETKYKIVNVTSISEISDQVNRVVWSIIGALAAVLILAIMAALLLFGYLNKPIVGLYAAMNSYRKGNLDERIPVTRRDELGQLGIGFNEMAEQIALLIQKNQEEQRKKQEISMRFLQAQISPHFLYNTLNSIKALARMNRSEEACEMITSLISLLRVASSGSEEITLGQELRYVESYVLLMSQRKDIHVDLQTEIPDGLRNCMILKFTLQPFVENSIIHGVSDNCLWIRILAWTEQDKLKLSVRDNGLGFDPIVLESRQTIDAARRFNKIGISNVQERIKLYYGDTYGVEIESAPQKGTRVTITLPLTEPSKTEMGDIICRI